jgi:hypothetical protein
MYTLYFCFCYKINCFARKRVTRAVFNRERNRARTHHCLPAAAGRKLQFLFVKLTSVAFTPTWNKIPTRTPHLPVVRKANRDRQRCVTQQQRLPQSPGSTRKNNAIRSFAGRSAFFLSLTETITITPIVKRALRGHLDARLIISRFDIYFCKFHTRGWERKKKSKTESPTQRCPSFLCVRGVGSRSSSGESWPGGRYRSECRSSSLSVRIASESASLIAVAYIPPTASELVLHSTFWLGFSLFWSTKIFVV